MKNSKKKSKENPVGIFAGFALLSKAQWDKAKFISDLKKKWGLDAVVNNDGWDKRQDTLAFEVGNMIAMVGFASVPIPNAEAEENAKYNYLWNKAVEMAKAHKAHLVVAVVGKEKNIIEKGKLFSKVISCLCDQDTVTGIYVNGTVLEPQFYKDYAEVLKDGELPIMVWIWFGLHPTETFRVCCYTNGLNVFGKPEMEILNADANPNDVRDFLIDMTYYVIDADVTLKGGEKIGFSDNDVHTITRSKGVFLPGMTLKISYEPKKPFDEED
ncbi:DUF4261 domain-containing protein [Treponema phagedenis]|uniref:DUF4261 domain-containing protein n=1 Tax=Treponema phagedenis TaxID=162 RepID=A0A0B7GR37_TREPH|nr:DUF4261 domain-containing protein [Treponema phagedenis]QEJ95847.1 DUF4261 domain-containing protein [Treponema phagedenis]QSH94045.1 DUF4261 domain-containing protein [Treponema phagedenis]QSH98527.1 DUF4261 domain-containing protein [Treponema phagedenis]CEM61044.1 conserved exported hypothetical protein [Treponema phagedenis]